jgi:hypothetical protein
VDEKIPEHLRPLITSQVFEFAQEAQRDLANNDLVVVLDLTSEEPELSAHARTELIDSVGGRVQSKLATPAASAHKSIQSPHLSFWLLVIHSDEQMDCAALNASLLGPAGHA